MCKKDIFVLFLCNIGDLLDNILGKIFMIMITREIIETFIAQADN